MRKKSNSLTYTGGGFGGVMPGIPPRDLTPEEVEFYGGEEFLIDTRLYKPYPQITQIPTEKNLCHDLAKQDRVKSADRTEKEGDL